MAAPALTAELKRELLIVKMRGALDPKRFYRSSDKKLPTYFQMGTVVGGADDNDRTSKRDRQSSMMGELLADSKIKKRAKTQFLKSQAIASEGVKRSRKSKPKPRGGRK